jgi:putative Mn2+ efflux pump MntP
MVALAFVTSIDALAVGLTLAMIEVAIWMPALIIGLVACALTIAGLLLGCRVGERWGRRVGVAGGIILILIGGKILFSALLLPKAIAASIG